MSEVRDYNVGHGGQQVIKAPKPAKKQNDTGKVIKGKDLRAGKK